VVQRDIRDQLGLKSPANFIHGFRRSNIAIEVVETGPSQRPDLAQELLAEPARRPAIVYTPSRKQAESVAALLAGDFPAAAYHAGLDAERRRRVQDAFLAGKLEVIVATIAFGMGIDKPNIRSVIHTALPGSVEAYYQEIGRAGRDGEPSRAVLMHSYADRYTHDFFFERDYPDVNLLDQIYGRLRTDPQPRELLEKQTRIPADVFEKALEKLWTHGGAMVDAADQVSRGNGTAGADWRELYLAQGEQKRAQIEAMIRYAQSNQCRMASLVRHFGDVADGQKPCGICDFCAPETCIAQRFRAATQQEQKVARQILDSLTISGRSVGQLHSEVCRDLSLTRDEFEELLGAMARVGLVRLTDAVFEKDGKQIPFRKAHLTREADYVSEDKPLELTIRDTMPKSGARRRKTTAKPKAAMKKKKAPAAEPSRQNTRVEAALRAWRTGLAKRQGVPAFRIMSDRVLLGIAQNQPQSARELLAIPGIGIASVEKYGAQIYKILNEARG
jgi:superfamily II DNA helicase RecQ